MPSTSRVAARSSLARAVAEKVRTVASKAHSSGMTFSFVPPAIRPTVTTSGSNASNCRVTIACSAVTISHATGIGSSAFCGRDPCPPAPMTRTRSWSQPAISGPARPDHPPSGWPSDVTCSPYAATTRRPAASSTPSRIMIGAPPVLSSPGWNMNTTSPASSSRIACRIFAAPTRPAVCRSCPQACISPGPVRSRAARPCRRAAAPPGRAVLPDGRARAARPSPTTAPCRW